MEAIRSAETSVVVTATWRNIPEDDIFHSLHRENLESYTIPLLLRVNSLPRERVYQAVTKLQEGTHTHTPWLAISRCGQKSLS
jgi:hypothetical protein